MTLTRVWTPTGSYSSGSTKRLIVLHSTEGFTGANGAYDCAEYFQGDVGASSQVCIDNNRGKIWECVSRSYGSWTQCSFNSVSVSAEQCGYASWSRDYWLNNRGNELHNAADWIAEEAKKLGIPIIHLTSSQAQSGSAGVCYHSHLGSSGCGHSDPGGGYPIDQVIAWAKGGTSAPEPAQEVFMSSSVFDSNGGRHLAGVTTDGRVQYRPPGAGWRAVDPNSNAKSNADIAYNGITDRVFISYTNQNSEFCTYDMPVGGSEFGWSNQGGGSFR